MRSFVPLGLAAVLALPAAAQTSTPKGPPSTPIQTPTSASSTPPPPAVSTTPAQGSSDSKAATATTSTKAEDKKPDEKKADEKKPVDTAKAKTDSIPSPGEALDPHIKAGSEDDVNSIGTRSIGGRGLGNWYSTDWELRVGKQYSMEIEKSAHMVTDPVIVEYVNRVGQNLVKNSDAKVPFTIKVIDSDEVNAMALPGGFFYVNSGLILACDEEAELAGVMAHEISHVVAHHAAREMTKMNYAQIGSIPLLIMTQGSWTGYGIYEASQLAVPMAFLKFSRVNETEADYLGVQYMYRAGYDPQSFITLFEKLDALEKHKPGTLAKAFSDHPQTPDRIAHSEDEIATILPAKPDYIVTTSEFDDVKSRLARLENKRKLNDKKDGSKPTLRRAGGSNSDPNSTNNPANSTDDRPTLGRRNLAGQ
ncbi:M48 family metalloprotease [Granulicella sp. WH15]|uniref:M48 family metallopeptidase n=1 Tax=Granulicella sp. WH15 TaxID=2602070 RepID=UPI001366B7EC|nr:M48 family metallopeptidase [Granulicella sp. WH15]QHN03715.1 M48 family metalloprotease [Granulicella sp. WH15]